MHLEFFDGKLTHAPIQNPKVWFQQAPIIAAMLIQEPESARRWVRYRQMDDVRSICTPPSPLYLLILFSDFADEHPFAEVFGVDLSPIQPVWVPPSCEFFVDDINLPWRPRRYDFIHIRDIAGSVPDLSELHKTCLE